MSFEQHGKENTLLRAVISGGGSTTLWVELTAGWEWDYGLGLDADPTKAIFLPGTRTIGNFRTDALLYDTPPPEDWSFEKANADSETIQQYLDAKQAKMVRVPYKMNRCVLFDSTYFHTTDDIHFKDGYENRRINCTLLFGKGL